MIPDPGNVQIVRRRRSGVAAQIESFLRRQTERRQSASISYIAVETIAIANKTTNYCVLFGTAIRFQFVSAHTVNFAGSILFPAIEGERRLFRSRFEGQFDPQQRSWRCIECGDASTVDAHGSLRDRQAEA